MLLVFSIAAVDDRGNVPAQQYSSFDPLASKYPTALKATLEAFGKGVGEFEGGLFAATLAALPSDSAAASTAVSDYILLYRARANLELGKGQEALNLFRTLQSQHPDSTVLGQAVLGKSRALLILHDPTGALAALEGAQAKDNAEVSCLRGQALEQSGKSTEAARLYLQVFADFVGSSQSDIAERRLQVLSPSFVVRAENREPILRRADNLIRAGRNLEARTLLQKLEGVPKSGLQTEKVQLLLGDADTNLGRLTEALHYLRRITGPSFASQVNYLEGVCYRGLGNEAAFLETRVRALRLFPQSPYTEKLLYSIATYYDVDNRVVPAREAYQGIARSFPEGEYAARALWKLALYAYLEERYEEALGGFRRCLLMDSRPSAASASAYWMGRCCEHLGDLDRAAILYRRVQALANDSYYGQRAHEALSALQPLGTAIPHNPAVIDFGEVNRKLDAIRLDPITIPQPSAAAARAIERARQLTAAGLPNLALAELEHASAVHGENDKALYYGMSRIHQSKEDFLNAILTLRQAFPEYNNLPFTSLPGEIRDILFPVRHFNFVTQHAAKNKLDPALVLALIRQESAFDAAAHSKSNARGLMQVLPTTGRELAHQASVARYTVTMLYNPETNIALGTRYLAGLLRRYDGRVELALAAYNAGDNRIDRWLREFGNADMAEFVERIPFSETRGYVKTVMSNAAHYRLLTAPSPGLALSPWK